MNIDEKIKAEEVLSKEALLSGDRAKYQYHLGRVHILSQSSVGRHLKVHYLMFLYACFIFDKKEIFGQILRLIVTVPGHMLGKVPKGNTGWSSVGLTQTLPLPEDLKPFIKEGKK